MKSIQMKLTIVILTIFLVALSALSGFNYWKARMIITDFVVNDMQQRAQNSAGDVGDWLEARKAEIAVMSVAPVVQGGRPEAIIPFLANATKASKDYDGINFAETNGLAHNSTGGTFSVAERSYFQKAMNGESSISDPLLAKDTGHLVLVIAIPV